MPLTCNKFQIGEKNNSKHMPMDCKNKKCGSVMCEFKCEVRFRFFDHAYNEHGW